MDKNDNVTLSRMEELVNILGLSGAMVFLILSVVMGIVLVSISLNSII